MLEWLRISLAGLLTLVFAVPLAALAKNRTIRDEPVGMLVLNMTLTAFLFSSLFVFTVAVDLATANNTPPVLCLSVISLGTSLLVAFKLSTLCLAVEQLIAVAFSLHHFSVMDRWTKRMLTLTWLFAFANTFFGLLCYYLDMETTTEFDSRVFDVDDDVKQCRWKRQANVFMIFNEAFLFLFSISSCALLIYTAFQGIKHERRLVLIQVNNQPQQFVMRFKSFKRIVKVLLTMLVVDIVGTGFRISSHWLIQSPLITLVHYLRILLLIVEYWTYGLSHTTVRNTLKAFFGIPENQIHPEEHALPVRQPQSFAQAELALESADSI